MASEESKKEIAKDKTSNDPSNFFQKTQTFNIFVSSTQQSEEYKYLIENSTLEDHEQQYILRFKSKLEDQKLDAQQKVLQASWIFKSVSELNEEEKIVRRLIMDKILINQVPDHLLSFKP